VLAEPEEKRGSETNANMNHTLYYHEVGTDQAKDVMVYATPDNPKWTIGGSVSDDGKTLLVLHIMRSISL